MYFLTVLYDHQSLLVHIPLSHLVSIVNQIVSVPLIAKSKLPTRKRRRLNRLSSAVSVMIRLNKSICYECYFSFIYFSKLLGVGKLGRVSTPYFYS